MGTTKKGATVKEPENLKAVAENLASLRSQKGWSQEDLSLRSDVDIETIKMIENQAIPFPKTTELMRMAHLFGLKLYQLFLPDAIALPYPYKYQKPGKV